MIAATDPLELKPRDPYSNSTDTCSSESTIILNPSYEHIGSEQIPTPRKRSELRVKALPLEYEACNVQDLGAVVSDLLVEIITYNDTLSSTDVLITRFHSRYKERALREIGKLTFTTKSTFQYSCARVPSPAHRPCPSLSYVPALYGVLHRSNMHLIP